MDCGGARTERRITTAACAEASDALALIAALALDARSAKTAPTGRAPSPQPGATSGQPADADAAARPPADAATRAAARLPSSARTGEVRGPALTTPASVSQSSAADRPQQDTSELTEDAPGAARGRMSVVAAGMLVAGVEPALHPALQLAATLARNTPGGLEFALRAGLRLAPGQTEVHPEGVVAFSWWSAVSGLCLGVRNRADTTSWLGCAAVELGRLSAGASETLRPRDEDRLWAALGPAAVVEWNASPRLTFQAGVEALFPTVRDRFLLADDTVYRAPALGVRGELGAGLRIW